MTEIVKLLFGGLLPTLTLAGAANLVYTVSRLCREGVELATLCMGMMGLGQLLAAACLWLLNRNRGTEESRRRLKQGAKLGGVILGTGFMVPVFCMVIGAEEHPAACWGLLGLGVVLCGAAAWVLLRPRRPSPKMPPDQKEQRRLEQLERLRDAGLLDKEEYEARRKEIWREP